MEAEQEPYAPSGRGAYQTLHFLQLITHTMRWTRTARVLHSIVQQSSHKKAQAQAGLGGTDKPLSDLQVVSIHRPPSNELISLAPFPPTWWTPLAANMTICAFHL
jgi:hypothetical protein